MAQHTARQEPIAIIGMALRGPGDASDTEKFWNLLCSGRTARSEIPRDRYSVDGFYHPDPERKGSIQQRYGHFLEQDFRVFDAPFFSVTPKEAKAMDPTHRMLLEAAYEGFENAGLGLNRIAGTRTGVYVGTFTGDFANLQARDNSGPSIYNATGLSASLASNRLSWFYDLRGPSLTVDTACSSSLTAFHMGCAALRSGEAEMALVAGANLMFGPDMSILLGAAKILSPEGKSKMWDASADGFARGEGVGVTVLKPLSAALRDGDTVRAVVLASALNEDGRTPGISLPSSEAQMALIRTAYEAAGVDMAETGYVEAHGTGTQAGDPLEARAIVETMGGRGKRKNDLYVGSVKTNIGHLEGAAGVAGVIKAALVVERGVIPKNLWFQKLNPQIEALLPDNVKVPLESTQWPTWGPRRASVNSFGFGGANAHIILEDAASYFTRNNLYGNHTTALGAPSSPSEDSGYNSPLGDDSSSDRGSDYFKGSNASTPRIFALSANDQSGIKRNAARLEKFLSGKAETEGEGQFLSSLAYTLSNRRTAMPWRSFVVASSASSLISSLGEPEGIPAAVRTSNSSSTNPPRVAFMFTGQGAAWAAMGSALFRQFKAFRNSITKSERVLKEQLGCPWSLREEVFDKSKEESNLDKTDYAQPACTALQLALVDLFTSWGIQPSAVVGHSSGEIAAAYAAGYLSHEAAMSVAWLRGQVSGTVAKTGGMLAVKASAELTQEKLNQLTAGRAVVGCINSPAACTVSGDRAAVDELETLLREDGVPVARLGMNVAYHSFHMEAARDAYEAALASVPHVIPDASDKRPVMFSSVTGRAVAAGEVTPSYWTSNLVAPVNFSGAVKALLSYTDHEDEKLAAHERTPLASIFLELGPHSALRGYAHDIFAGKQGLSYSSALRKNHDGTQTALSAVGELWMRGCAVDLTLANGTKSRSMRVDLPPYAWNHTAPNHVFWDEAPLSKAYRLREKPRTDLLGLRVPAAADPTWRNFLRVSEQPWIREHVVQGDILYPGAGILIMAIEAAKELASEHENEEVAGYELRDVSISTALRVPDDSEKGTEVLVTLHARRTGTKAAPDGRLWEFAVTSRPEGEDCDWSVHARGLVSATFKSSLASAGMASELAAENASRREAFLSAKSRCPKPARNFLYDSVEAIGMHYGPVFRNVDSLFAGPDDNLSVGSLLVPDTQKSMPQSYEYPHVVHPATLDSVLHLLFPCISGPDQQMTEAVVPFSFDRIYIASSLADAAPGARLHGWSTASKTSYTTWMADIVVGADADFSEPSIVIEGLGVASVGATDSAAAAGTADKETRAGCFGTKWYRAPELMAPSETKDLVYDRTLKSKNANEDESTLDDLEFACLVHIYDCLAWFETAEGKEHIPTDGFWGLYVQWMRDVIRDFDPLPADPQVLQKKLAGARERIVLSPSGDVTLKMVDRIGTNLRRIFTREVEPLQVMTEGDLLYDFYRGAFGTAFNANVAEYIGLLADTQPGVRILEIGAGTGGTTFHVLERLREEDGTSKAGRYTFTDISPGFLAKAADRFVKDAGVLEFKTLNIENSPFDQPGFENEKEGYDLIVAANVLHATKSIGETLDNCKSVLKPGGKIVLSEVTIKRIFSGFIMGPLPGWWLGEDDGRKGGPLLDVPEWHAALLQAGFSGVDMDIRGDRPDSKEPVSLIVSTKPAETSESAASQQQYAILTRGQVAQELASALREEIATRSLGTPSIISWEALSSEGDAELKDKYVICLAEWESPLLVDLTDADWARLRSVIRQSAHTLWVTGGGATDDCSEPLKGGMVGLARAIRNEDASVSLITCDVEPPSALRQQREALSKAASGLLTVALHHSRGLSPTEGEFAVRNGKTLVPRVERLPRTNASLKKYQAQGEPEPASFTGCGRPLKLTIQTPGLLDTFRWIEDETYHTPLQDDWIEVQVKAVGLNFKDVLVALGNLNERKLGVDAAGIVTRVGKAVTDYRVGDKVMTASCDTFATYVRFPAAGAIAMPEDLSFEEASSMPLISLTAYYALVTMGRLERGESLLIHAAAGGVGQAAIQLAQHLGLEIYCTVGSEEKKALITKEYGIPAERIFSSRDSSFAKGIMRATGGQGVDAVLNSLAGELLRQSWHCLAKFGRFLEIGKADLFANTGLDMKPFLDNKSYIGVNLLDFENNPCPRAVKLWRETTEMIQQRVFTPIRPIQRFGVDEVEKAFRYMQQGRHTGKVVVQLDAPEDILVQAVPRTPVVGVHADATYVIAGLGGICREIASYLALKGARNLVFMSRSAASGVENVAFADELRSTHPGLVVRAFDCDVGDEAALGRALSQVTDLPAIRGCVTGAMVLSDTLFDKMTAAHVRTTVGPKIKGTWNLHNLLPKQLDFFVCLSSLAGVMGHRGQGNYGIGNIFQDVFSSFRRAQGLKACTIDIGYLLSVGFVAQNTQYVDHVRSMGLKVMTNADLHGLMASAVDCSEANADDCPAQIMCGLPFGEYDEKWYWIEDAKFTGLRQRVALADQQGGGKDDGTLRDELAKCAEVHEAAELITTAMAARLARLMMMPESDVDVGRPLSAYGVDSLVAVEVRNWIAKEVGVDVSVFDIMANVPMRNLAGELAGKRKAAKAGE
nr:alternapyrone polyketide synthase [Menisporopsis theobromae]